MIPYPDLDQIFRVPDQKIQSIQNENGEISVLHAQGLASLTERWEILSEILPSRNWRHIKNLNVVTVTNQSPVDIYFRLRECGFDTNNLIVLGREIKEWWLPYKIRYLIDWLKAGDYKPYTLFIDGQDVALNDLNGMIEKFERFNCDMLMNAQNTPFPNFPAKDTGDESGQYNYVNTGAWIAKTNKILPFFEAAWEADIRHPEHKLNDQSYVRAIYDESKWNVRLDRNAEIFQTVENAEDKINIDLTYEYKPTSKVYCLGKEKTGRASVAEAVRRLGFEVEITDDYKKYPDSPLNRKFILTERDPARLMVSLSMSEGAYRASEVRQSVKDYEDWSKQVKTHFGLSHTFLSVDLEKDFFAAEKIAAWLRRPVERFHMPWKNKNNLSWPKVSFCTAYKNRSEDLIRTLKQNIKDNIDYENVEFVIVDYDSEDRIMDEALQSEFYKSMMSRGILKYFIVKGKPFINVAHCKNMAHRLATGDILCNVDADNFTGKHFAEYLAKMTLKHDYASFFACDEKVWQTKRCIQRGADGRVAVRKEIFDTLQGYNESLNGYGADDYELKQRLRNFGLREIRIDRSFYREVIQHSDRNRSRFFANKDIDESQKIVDRSVKRAKDERLLSVNNGSFGCGFGYMNFDFSRLYAIRPDGIFNYRQTKI